MSTETSVDISALVGEMESPGCDHSLHMKDSYHSDEPATHYVRSHCTGCAQAGRVYPACPRWIETVRTYEEFECLGCGGRGPMSDFVTILGPVNK